VAKTVGAAMKHYMPQEQQNTFKGSNESPYKLKGIWKWPAQSTNSTKSFFQYNHYFKKNVFLLKYHLKLKKKGQVDRWESKTVPKHF